MTVTLHASGYCNDQGMPLCGAEWSNRSHVAESMEKVTCNKCLRWLREAQRDYEQQYAKWTRMQSRWRLVPGLKP